MSVFQIHRLGLLVLASAALGACSYDAPPETLFQQPDGGVFKSGDPIVLHFSEPIDPQTLSIRIWPGPRTLEGDIPTDDSPLLERCTPAMGTCGNAQLTVYETLWDGDESQALSGEGLASSAVISARLQLDPQHLGKPNQPLLIEVEKGLADAKGNRTGVATVFDVQFLPKTTTPSGEPIPFQNGAYIIVSTLKEPIAGLVITLISDVASSEDGVIAIAGADGDENEGAPKNTSNPDEMHVDDTERGFTMYATGQLSQFGGDRFLETQPIPMVLSLGAIHLTLNDLVFSAKVTAHSESGNDRLEGTLSYSALTLEIGGEPVDYEAGSSAFVGHFVPTEDKPAGMPSVCGDLCGAVPVQCNPPTDFPPPGVCAESVQSPAIESGGTP